MAQEIDEKTYEDGVADGRAEGQRLQYIDSTVLHLNALRKSLKISYRQAMKLLGLPKAERPIFMEHLHKANTRRRTGTPKPKLSAPDGIPYYAGFQDGLLEGRRQEQINLNRKHIGAILNHGEDLEAEDAMEILSLTERERQVQRKIYLNQAKKPGKNE